MPVLGAKSICLVSAMVPGPAKRIRYCWGLTIINSSIVPGIAYRITAAAFSSAFRCAAREIDRLIYIIKLFFARRADFFRTTNTARISVSARLSADQRIDGNGSLQTWLIDRLSRSGHRGVFPPAFQYVFFKTLGNFPSVTDNWWSLLFICRRLGTCRSGKLNLRF